MYKSLPWKTAVFLFAAILATMLSIGSVLAASIPIQTPLSGNDIPKYVEALPHFAGQRITGDNFKVSAHEFQEKVLPTSFYSTLRKPFKDGTYVWGYKVTSRWGQTFGPYYPGFTIEATRGLQTSMLYANELPIDPILNHYIQTDQTIHWANPLDLDMMDPARFDSYAGPPPMVTHLHGGEVPSEYDGGPDAWFTPNGLKGPAYRSATAGIHNGCVYQYPNRQEPTTLWFHDHALGATRLNVYRGLAAFYLIRDWFEGRRNPKGIERPDLPGGPSDTLVNEPGRAVFTKNTTYKPEIELAIQDRMFDTNGQLYFPSNGDNPLVHPTWLPEFFGDCMLVNGKTWPFLNVEPRRYRFRVLDGCNARFLSMWLQNDFAGNSGPVVWQIGSDGGLLDVPAKLDPNDSTTLFMAPGERADIIIDFRGFEGQVLTLHNNAAAPFPDGDPYDPATTGQIMQFRVGRKISHAIGHTGDPSYNPATGGSPRMQRIVQVNPNNATVNRELTLNEAELETSPIEIMVNNTGWTGERQDSSMGGRLIPIPGFVPDGHGNYLSELPKIGSTEIWTIINLTGDAHPIHLHLVQFQLLDRQDFDVDSYFNLYASLFPGQNWVPAFGPPNNYFTLNDDGAVGGNPAVSPFLIPGTKIGPLPEETGWKDTVKMWPGQVTRIAVRFTGQDAKPFPFDATGTMKIAFDKENDKAEGPGYVWHCHIVDHEDNEMMRPYKLVK